MIKLTKPAHDYRLLKYVTRFWQKVSASNQATSCWPWTGHIRRGYGQFWFDGQNRQASRCAYIFTFGPIKEGLDVLHRCDNPVCCNPSHLFLGDDRDNAIDCRQKGRANNPSGERHGCAKLTREQVVLILDEAPSAGFGYGSKKARELGVCRSTIRRIILGKQWRGVFFNARKERAT